jgi:tetratricopeptide (TPR) repeat protein
MALIDKTVFISYRRTSVPWALAVYQNLTSHGYDVFFDYEGVGSGDFERVIIENIRARAHFLLLLTPSALERINDPGDWLRREIETALASRRNIVPLMLDGFDFGTPSVAKRLTGDLALLAKYNGLQIVASYFAEGMERLRSRHLSVQLATVLHPPSQVAATAARQQQATAAGAPQVEQRDLSAEQWFERGFEAVDAGEKIRCFSEVIRLAPRHAHAYARRGRARLEVGQGEAGWADLDQALRLAPDDGFLYWFRGLARRDAKVAGALDDLNEAIRLQPENSYNHSTRGSIREDSDDFIGARDDFSEAIRLEPGRATAFYFRSGVRRKLGDLSGALEDASEAIRLSPQDAGYYQARAYIREDLKDFAGAVADYTKAIQLVPNEPSSYLFRGRLLEDRGDIDGAIADLEAYLRNGDEKLEAAEKERIQKRLARLRDR